MLKKVDHVPKTSEEENYDEFIERVKYNAFAIKVKLKDLSDNMDIRRIPEVTAKDVARLNKYLKAYHFLKNL